MKFLTTLLALCLLMDVMIAQISFFDNRFPPSPASRRTIVIRTGQMSGRRSAALLQAPEQQQQQQQQQEQVFQRQEEAVNEPDQQELQEPILQQMLSTERPQRNGNGVTQQTIPSRPVNGISRVTQTQQQLDQKLVGTEEGSEEEVSQRQDSAMADISMEDVSTERITPSVTFSSSEEQTDDGFTPTVPEIRPIVTTSMSTQRKGNGNGRLGNGNGRLGNGNGRLGNGNGRQSNGKGRKTLVPSDQKPVGNGIKPSNGKKSRDRTPVTQTTEFVGTQATDGQVSDSQLPDQRIEDDSIESDRVLTGDRQESEGQSYSGDPIQGLREAVRGEPGADYPIFFTPPETGFKCSDQQYPGYYADVEARCQVFYICQSDGRSDAFLCPNGTIFSQQNYVCVWWYEFDCSTAAKLYSLNAQLYSSPLTSGDSDQQTAQPLGPTGEPAIDAISDGPEGIADQMTQSFEGQSIESQQPDSGQVFETEIPSLPAVAEGSQQVVSDETPSEVMVTTRASIDGLRSPNGRPVGGLKGIRKNKNGIRNGNSNGNGAKRNGQNGVQQKTSVTTTRPINGLKRNGIPQKTGINGQPSIPFSPADKARNGIQKTTKTNGANGLTQKKRLNGSTKSVYRDRTSQKQELDGQSSNWYYFRGI